ncbi:MAG: hypothetical protein J3Q66DRAFT_406591 [Benniella sp.]|nr:MAG: hypothetical protein J3Q66DRAFT_406591 [Benniella sp.]
MSSGSQKVRKSGSDDSVVEYYGHELCEGEGRTQIQREDYSGPNRDSEGNSNKTTYSLFSDTDTAQSHKAIEQLKSRITIRVSWIYRMICMSKDARFGQETSQAKEETNDKILISNLAQILEKLCRQGQYVAIRFDDHWTSMDSRLTYCYQPWNWVWSIVTGWIDDDQDTRAGGPVQRPNNNEFVFLLSSKAGECNLNLIGTNRLVLCDFD